MSKAQLYAFTKQKLVLLTVAVLVSQVSLFGAGYLLSTILRPEPVMVAANGQPCSLPGLAASAAPSTAPASASPAAGAAAPANPAAEVGNAEKSASGAVANAAAQPAAAEAALQSAAAKQVPPEFAAAAKGAPAQLSAAPANAATTVATGAAAGSAASPNATSAAAAGAPLPATPAGAANPKVAAVACENVPDIMNADADTSSEPHKYAVQIGAFLDPNNALRLASEFKAKGYQPCLMIAADRQGRRWTVVRMGSFSDVGKASTYARSISGREQTVALVRPADSF